MRLDELRCQHAKTQCYLGSPSIVRTPAGALLATHDYFGPGSDHNHEDAEHLTSVYRSRDGGAAWQHIGDVAGAFWSTLFVHRGAVCLLGTSQEWGSIVIRRTGDEGDTWTDPADAKSGLLFKGGHCHDPPNYHCAPVPVLRKDGRLYRAFEDCDPLEWGRGFQSFVISIAEDADLLDASSWTKSNRLPMDPAWAPGRWQAPANLGWLEGNVVVAPNGETWNILRVNSEPEANKAAVVRVRDGGRQVSFDPRTGFIDFPGGHTKFTIRRDERTGLYLTLSNDRPTVPNFRNVLSLCSSENLTHWEHRLTLLEDDSGLPPEESARVTGFQYADWQFDGGDLIFLVRTAYDGAHNMHDANRITFHRLTDFRRRLCG